MCVCVYAHLTGASRQARASGELELDSENKQHLLASYAREYYVIYSCCRGHDSVKHRLPTKSIVYDIIG